MLKRCMIILHDVLILGLCPYKRLLERLNNLWLHSYTGISNTHSFFLCCAKLWACSKTRQLMITAIDSVLISFHYKEPARTKRSKKPWESRGSKYCCFFKYGLSFNH